MEFQQNEINSLSEYLEELIKWCSEQRNIYHEAVVLRESKRKEETQIQENSKYVTLAEILLSNIAQYVFLRIVVDVAIFEKYDIIGNIVKIIDVYKPELIKDAAALLQIDLATCARGSNKTSVDSCDWPKVTQYLKSYYLAICKFLGDANQRDMIVSFAIALAQAERFSKDKTNYA